MGLDIYWIGLLVPNPLVAVVAGHRIILRPFHRQYTEKSAAWSCDDDASQFRRTFLQVYLLVMGSEWLQGPYMYSLFQNEKGLDEATVATLYTSTYASAAISALFTGYVTDRVLGGIGITVLWTAFESWMVAEYNARSLDQSSLSLSAMFGTMTTSNCITAILAGVLGHCVVLALGSKTDPFMVGVAMDICAAILMLRTWNENRGVSERVATQSESNDDMETQQPLDSGKTRMSLRDARIWMLSFISCCFEGTIFLLMFFWPGTLQEAHDREHQEDTAAIPYGVVFATFMAVMVLGALLFNALHRKTGLRTETPSRLPNLFTPTRLLALALFLGAASFLIAVLANAEMLMFSAFLLLEACNGIYVPSIAYHRGMIVDDSATALSYSLMNIPLFIFVVVALRTTSGSEGDHRQSMFMFCATILLAAALMALFGLGIPQSSHGLSGGFERQSRR